MNGGRLARNGPLSDGQFFRETTVRRMVHQTTLFSHQKDRFLAPRFRRAALEEGWSRRGGRRVPPPLARPGWMRRGSLCYHSFGFLHLKTYVTQIDLRSGWTRGREGRKAAGLRVRLRGRSTGVARHFSPLPRDPDPHLISYRCGHPAAVTTQPLHSIATLQHAWFLCMMHITA
jgi:hypothetical protein